MSEERWWEGMNKIMAYNIRICIILHYVYIFTKYLLTYILNIWQFWLTIMHQICMHTNVIEFEIHVLKFHLILPMTQL